MEGATSWDEFDHFTEDFSLKKYSMHSLIMLMISLDYPGIFS